ncbi:MAG: hypothetical protein ACRD8U_02575 [Pyrinomonadaceae bacterium]
MENISPTTSFRRGAIEPMVCLREGWALIQDQYWIFVGMSLVAMLLGSFVPLGILLGPMMCGIYLAIFKRRRGEPVEFGILFKGFDYFGESVIASLIHYIPLMVIIIAFYVFFYGGFILIMVSQGGSEPDPASLFGFLVVMIVAVLVLIVVILLISLVFTFSYPLIVDRRLSGLEAVKLSARASLANFWSLFALLLLNGLLASAGALLCYVGIFLAFPVTFAAIAKAYEQVFGLDAVKAPNLPPPPPSFN